MKGHKHKMKSPSMGPRSKVFRETNKKPEPDNKPLAKGGRARRRRLEGVVL